MNQVVLMGRLTRDPEVRYTSGEKAMAVARYTLAVDRRGKGERNADFIPCVAFDKAAEFAEKYFRQGMRVLVSGRIQTGSYTNREGQKVYTTQVILEDQEFADSKGAGNGGSGNYNSAPQTGYAEERRPSPQNASTEGFMNIPDGVEDEGLPFN